MRITPNLSGDNALYNLQQGRGILDALQEQAVSGMQVNRPSDDPLTARQLLDLQNQIDAGEQYNSNITKGSLLLNVTSTAISTMADIMKQVQSVAGSMASGSSDPTLISGATSNLAQLKQQLIDLGNTQIGNQFVFAGYKNSQPFDSAGNFSGTNDQLSVQVTQSSQIATTVSGGALLRGGTPPAAVGSGATAGKGPVDILGSIDALIIAISGNNTVAIKDGIKNMKAGSDQVNTMLNDVANRQVRMNNVQTMITNNQNTLKTIYDNKQNVDYAKIGVELSQKTTAFNAALSVTAKISQLSLLDYMR